MSSSVFPIFPQCHYYSCITVDCYCIASLTYKHYGIGLNLNKFQPWPVIISTSIFFNYLFSCQMWFWLLIHYRWRCWGCCLGQGSSQIFWIGFAICWCRLSGGYFVWISSWVCFHSTTWTKFSFCLFFFNDILLFIVNIILKGGYKKTSFLKELSFSRIQYPIVLGCRVSHRLLVGIFDFSRCYAAIIFIHPLSFCSVVNGALEYLAKDLGIAENTVLQGKCNVMLVWHLKIRIPWSWCK